MFIWDSVSGEVVSKKVLPKGSRLVTAIGISANDKYVAASDAAEKITVHVFDIAGGSAPICSVAINMKVVHLAFSKTDDAVFATAGKDHMALCSIDGDKCSKKMGKGKGGKVESQAAIAWSSDKTCFTGSSAGQIVQWSGDDIKKQYDNNKGIVSSILCTTDKAAGGEVVLAGGKDKTLTAYSNNGGLKQLW